MTGSYRKSRCTCCNPRSRIINGNLAAESTQISVTVVEGQDTEGFRQELTYYQHRGRLIQDKCRNYYPNPVHLRGRVIRYWKIATSICIGWMATLVLLDGHISWIPISTSLSQFYPNIERVRCCGSKRHSKKKATESVLNCVSSIYQNDLLWTYGFICALLKYCSSAEHQSAQQMIWFDNATRFNVKPYKREIVFALINKMKAEKKVLPFFVLDEMRPNENIEAGGMNTSAF
ncbi:hypothetical protein Plhal703r1_c14g0070141 [Plasmopara halstedii]